MKVLIKLLFNSLLLGIAFMWSLGSALAIGLSPSQLYVENIPAGGKMETAIYISRGDVSSGQVYKVSISGEAAAYIKQPTGKLAAFSVGEDIVTHRIVIEPGNLSAGEYSADILIASYQGESEFESADPSMVTAGMSVNAAVMGSITFSVTNDEVEKYSIASLETRDVEENQLVGFSYFLVNEGNVDSRPEKIFVKVQEERNPDISYETWVTSESIPIVPGFSSEQVDITTDVMATPGVYSISLEFYNSEGEVFLTHNALRFQSYPEGTLSQSGELSAFSADKEKYETGESVIFTGVFKNTGELGTTITPIIEILKGDVRVEILTVEEIFVPKGREATFSYVYYPKDKGRYTAKGSAEYSIFKTEALESEFSVDVLSAFFYLLLLVVLSFVATGGYLFWRRRSKSTHKRNRSIRH